MTAAPATAPITIAGGMVLVALLWALCFPLIVMGGSAAEPLLFAALRALLAGGLLIALAVLAGAWRWPGWRDLGELTLIGLCFTAIGFGGMFLGAGKLTTGIATVLANLRRTCQATNQGKTMKTSVIDVRDMLSVLSVTGVEERIGEVPGVESVTVDFAAGKATVRFDETRLDVADIKSDVRQRSHAAANEPMPLHGAEAEPAGQAPPPQSPAPFAAKDTENAAPTTPKKDTMPVKPAATPPKGASSGAVLDNTGAAAAMAPVSEVAAPEATTAASPDGEAPGPIEKATAWVRQALTGDDKDKPEAPASSEAELPSKTSVSSPAAVAPAAGHAGHARHGGPTSPGTAPHEGRRQGP